MKFLVAAILLVALALADVRQHVVREDIKENELRALFSEFNQQFSKSYESAQHHESRFKVFSDNYKRAVFYSNLGQAKFGITKFSDLTPEEFAEKYLSTSVPAQPQIIPEYEREAKRLLSQGMPQTADWRTKGAVTPVKNQGQCGSCWAFSATGNLEGQAAIQSGKLTSLSEQQLVDCASTTGNHGCEGGLPTLADKYVIQAGGIVSETDYPYTAMDGSCHFDKSQVVVTATNYTAFPKNEPMVAAWLAEHGPVSIGINAGPLQFYLDDVIHLSSLFCDPKKLDHGVLFVGYDLTKQKYSREYWIIKNSWGADWGLKGYFLVEYDHNICGVSEMMSTAGGVRHV